MEVPVVAVVGCDVDLTSPAGKLRQTTMCGILCISAVGCLMVTALTASATCIGNFCGSEEPKSAALLLLRLSRLCCLRSFRRSTTVVAITSAATSTLDESPSFHGSAVTKI